MSFPIPVAAASVRTTVTASSQQFGAMVADNYYVLTSSIACYIKQGTNPTATAGDGSTIVGAGVPTIISGDQGAKLAIIRIGASDGEATLTKVQYFSRG